MSEPTITLPLSEFLKILWGYKKHAELRNRATPDLIITNAIKEQVPNYKDYVHIQDPEEGEDFLPTIWQRSEWHGSGEKLYERKKEAEKENFNADRITEAIAKKMPMFDKQFIRQLAFNVCNTKDFSSLKMFGIEEKDLKL